MVTERVIFNLVLAYTADAAVVFDASGAALEC